MTLFLSSAIQTLGNQFPKETTVSVHTYMSNSMAYMKAHLFSFWIPSKNIIKSPNSELKNHVLPLGLSSFGNTLGSVSV